jgi:hypothetical protein
MRMPHLSQVAHDPKVAELADGRWIVLCTDCECDRESAVPLGIGMPIATLEMAELLRCNHAGRQPKETRSVSPGGRRR